MGALAVFADEKLGDRAGQGIGNRSGLPDEGCDGNYLRDGKQKGTGGAVVGFVFLVVDVGAAVAGEGFFTDGMVRVVVQKQVVRRAQRESAREQHRKHDAPSVAICGLFFQMRFFQSAKVGTAGSESSAFLAALVVFLSKKKPGALLAGLPHWFMFPLICSVREQRVFSIRLRRGLVRRLRGVFRVGEIGLFLCVWRLVV